MSYAEDRALLAEALETARLSPEMREVLEDMRDRLDARVEEFSLTLAQHSVTLSPRQREVVQRVLGIDVPKYKNLASSGQVPRGREVPTPEVLRNLPLKPPGRR